MMQCSSDQVATRSRSRPGRLLAASGSVGVKTVALEGTPGLAFRPDYLSRKRARRLLALSHGLGRSGGRYSPYMPPSGSIIMPLEVLHGTICAAGAWPLKATVDSRQPRPALEAPKDVMPILVSTLQNPLSVQQPG